MLDWKWFFIGAVVGAGAAVLRVKKSPLPTTPGVMR
jgi:hypothetical protein